MTVRLLICIGLLALARQAGAQTDYYNTSSGRPLRVEDAMPVEYRGIEMGLGSLRFERGADRVKRWSLSPQFAIGILPRTELHIALPFEYTTPDVERGLAGVEISALHALNAETSMPALAIGGDVTVLGVPSRYDATYVALKAIATRTFPWARMHANAAVTAGPTIRGSDAAALRAKSSDVSRWWAGLAVDKTFPLHSLLISGETFVDKSVYDGADVEWNAGVGARYQLTPRWAVDGGGGRRLTGDERAWHVTVGWAYAVGSR